MRLNNADIDVDFERRWAAWQARGAVHDRKVRRRMMVALTAVMVAGASLAAVMMR